MTVPDFQSLMLPLLRSMSHGEPRRLADVVEQLAGEFHLTKEDRAELLSSGRTTRMQNRVGWARTYLKKAGLLEAPQRGLFRITPRGQAVLAGNPDKINIHFLEQFPEFVEFRSLHREQTSGGAAEEKDQSTTPEEQLEEAYQRLRDELKGDLLRQIKEGTPGFFERLVVDVLVKMGYGGSIKDAGRAVGRSGDGGIDGIIKEDRLGLDVIYVQAKRWDGTVGRPEVQKFAGALQGHRARKGVFITSSGFSGEAEEYARMIDSRIVLIDGDLLTDLMIDYGVGVSQESTYLVCKVDLDYFTE